jgi:pyruvate/2-oxoacid:ferredoxin oxidoreductase alpha subunit
VIEKALSYGYEGALCSDVKAALYEYLVGRSNGGLGREPNGGDTKERLPLVKGFIAGIGGRDIRTLDLTDTLRARIAAAMCDGFKGPLEERPDWIGIKL